MKQNPLLDRVIRQALVEDHAANDLTTNALVGSGHHSQAVIFSKENAIVCGLEIAKRVFELREKKVCVRLLAKDGQKIRNNQTVLRAEGPTRALLSAERVALNFLSY